MQFYLIYSICRSLKVITLEVISKKKKISTYPPKLKLMGRSTANKFISKNGLIHMCDNFSRKIFILEAHRLELSIKIGVLTNLKFETTVYHFQTNKPTVPNTISEILNPFLKSDEVN